MPLLSFPVVLQVFSLLEDLLFPSYKKNNYKFSEIRIKHGCSFNVVLLTIFNIKLRVDDVIMNEYNTQTCMHI